MLGFNCTLLPSIFRELTRAALPSNLSPMRGAQICSQQFWNQHTASMRHPGRLDVEVPALSRHCPASACTSSSPFSRAISLVPGPPWLIPHGQRLVLGSPKLGAVPSLSPVRAERKGRTISLTLLAVLLLLQPSMELDFAPGRAHCWLRLSFL